VSGRVVVGRLKRAPHAIVVTVLDLHFGEASGRLEHVVSSMCSALGA